MHVIFDAPYEKVMESVRLGLFDLLHTGVAIINSKGVFGYCNRAFIKMYALPDEVKGRHVKDFFFVNEKDFAKNMRERKMVITLGESTNHIYGVLLNYAIYNLDMEFCGVAIESIPCNLSREKLTDLLDSMKTLEMKAWNPQFQKYEQAPELGTFSGMIGKSPAMRNLCYLGERFAPSDQPVLITGESGTGKELVAHAIHAESSRASGPFVSVNCAALPAELIESELFGYEAGAFTGARSGGMQGKFEQADGGTIFLDEIGELPVGIQAKLLRVLESGEIQKIGHRGPLHSDFRLVGATNRDLEKMIRSSRFREDLYHRLSVFELNVPPLRERGEDVFLLSRYYLDQFTGIPDAVGLDSELEQIFRTYSWPGNIRELKNTLVYGLYALEKGQKQVGRGHLPQRFIKALRQAGEFRPDAAPHNTAACEYRPFSEQEYLKSTLERLKYNKALMARELGMSRSKLYRLLNKYGLNG